jgi:branched-chain amino acid transport system ATP-binding protein
MASPILEVHNVSKSFGEHRVLRDVGFSLGDPETLAIIGPNGAGKTTLVNVVTGLLKADSGTVLLAGTNISQKPAFRVARSGLARTFQITSLFLELTVRENVDVALVAWRKYRAAQVGKSAVRPPDAREIIALVGLEPVIDRRVDTLSHGDQRLLEVAVALACEPKVLLLDEPTAGMSPSETEDFIDLMNGRLKGRHAMVLIEHDMEVVVQTADRICVLAEGQVLATGAPQEIMNNTAVQEAYLGRA